MVVLAADRVVDHVVHNSPLSDCLVVLVVLMRLVLGGHGHRNGHGHGHGRWHHWRRLVRVVQLAQWVAIEAKRLAQELVVVLVVVLVVRMVVVMMSVAIVDMVVSLRMVLVLVLVVHVRGRGRGCGNSVELHLLGCRLLVLGAGRARLGLHLVAASCGRHNGWLERVAGESVHSVGLEVALEARLRADNLRANRNRIGHHLRL